MQAAESPDAVQVSVEKVRWLSPAGMLGAGPLACLSGVLSILLHILPANVAACAALHAHSGPGLSPAGVTALSPAQEVPECQ